ncbi:putative sulfate exporter family transporter [Sulfurospirillum sp. T05]|uniref:Sulfate exporter family transporter n=1 Tax=Sulfurospirillum tamanense TaxID=2813362 RepID=A0ABS2WTN3_9BACT|nr:putative sulfate exporter family transporter [Sulfurospirillum tamanensis]MBN2965001.1 putative sulfate exporter family transporter [Sulfurospirillum tamanensis]
MFWRGLIVLFFLSGLWGGLALVLTAQGYHVSPLITAVLGGMATSAVLPRLGTWLGQSGALKLGTKELLRLGIVLYGLHISLEQVWHVGFAGAGLALLVVTSTLSLGWFLGQKMGLDRHSALLIGAGSAICGAAAVLAVQSVMRSQSEKVVAAVATVVLFGTLGMLVYPWALSGVGNPFVQGLITGGTLHEVAHVVGAGAGLPKEAAEVAVIVKMIRVMFLVPVLFVLLFVFKSKGENGGVREAFPWFALFFLGMVALNSAIEVPFKQVLLEVDTMLLSIAMCALGLNTHTKTLRHMGAKPFLLASVLMVWLVGIGAGVVWVTM